MCSVAVYVCKHIFKGLKEPIPTHNSDYLFGGDNIDGEFKG